MEKSDISKTVTPVVIIIASLVLAAISILHLYFSVIL
jgi:hypothetical protein